MTRTVVTRTQWLDAGLESFGKSGRSGLRVEAMARSLGSSKAGFYWYFKSRARFEAELFEHWRAEETKRIIAVAETAGAPTEKIIRLATEVLHVRRSGDFLFHLRRHARTHRSVARLLEETEAERIGYLADVLVALGKEREEAREAAEVVYHLYLGWYERNQLTKTTMREVEKQLRVVGRIVGVDLDTGDAS